MSSLLNSQLYQFIRQNGRFTSLICLLCLFIFILQNLGLENFIFSLLHYPDSIYQQDDFWRYFSHSLVHLSFLHLLFNLSWFFIFGGAIERQFGALKLIFLYFISAIITGFIQNYFSGPDFFGLSGVVYAVLGYVLIIDKFSAYSFNLPEGFFSMLLIGLGLGFVSPYFGVEMGNAAHISGFLVGIIYGIFDGKIKPLLQYK